MWTEEEEEECMRMSTNHCSCASARILDVNQSYRDIQDNLNMQHTQSISHCLSVCHFYLLTRAASANSMFKMSQVWAKQKCEHKTESCKEARWKVSRQDVCKPSISAAFWWTLFSLIRIRILVYYIYICYTVILSWRRVEWVLYASQEIGLTDSTN